MYNAAVRIGNWTEDIELEKERLSSFIEKREKGKLLVQCTRHLFDNLLREINLSRSNDGFVKFGSCIQLKAADVQNSPLSTSTRTIQDNKIDYGVVMAGTINTKQIDEMSSLTKDCQLVASPLLIPCPRNSFIIKSADNTEKNDQNLLYGQEFVLQIVGSTGTEELYVRSEKPLIDGPHGPLEHDPVCLSDKKDHYSTWKVLHQNKQMRLESEGLPVSPFTSVIIRHSMSGLDLAAESNVWSLSIFGNECGLSVHKYLDVTKRETADCIWMFVTRDSYETSCGATD